MATNAATTYDEDANDQPIDYSKKYTERNVPTQRQVPDDRQSKRASKKEFREREGKVDLFGDYAETDLDQPTDYSLRYAEDDTDHRDKQTSQYFSAIIQEDTVKTYCTEGTPYETPFNFSTATSMSDLRVEEPKENELLKKGPKKSPENLPHENVCVRQVSFPRTTLALAPMPNAKRLEEKKDDLPILKPGQVTPEKSINYYEEEAPGAFSRANSLSSLNCSVAVRHDESPITGKIDITHSPIKPQTKSLVKANVSRLADISVATTSRVTPEDKRNEQHIIDKEGKMVTFAREDYYAEETPLMFSRCSSLGSLSGFEQHSIHDDRSSIVSDFSRRTSGIVSPSELPDSPTQTIPPSPRMQKMHSTDYVNKIAEEARPSDKQLPFPKSQPAKSSTVFEDDIATFKEESTPIEFSTATSLSSLTIDDDIKLPVVNRTSENQAEEEELASTDEQTKTDAASIANNEIEKESEQVSDGDEDDEDMLAACINIGMQNNRYRQSFKTTNVQKSVQPEPKNEATRYRTSSALNHKQENAGAVGKIRKAPIDIVVVPDTVHVYCTEDTPADISPVGSQSNLSALSMPSVAEDAEKSDDDKSVQVECHQNDLSDESSNLSGDDEKILDECIQSAMPKVRQITPPPASCIPFTSKPETTSEKFNLCGTPLSSPVDRSHSAKSDMLCKPLCRRPLVHDNELSDESPNHSEDEAILTECIQSAMPKLQPRLNTQSSQRPSSAKSNDTLMSKVHLRDSTAHLPYENKFVDGTRGEGKKDDIYDDSLSEEEEDIMLAQCIRSGMPKALQGSSVASQSIKKKIVPYTRSRNAVGNTSISHGNQNYSSKGAIIRNQVSCVHGARSAAPQGFPMISSQSCSRFPSGTSVSRLEDLHHRVRSCDNTFENANISGSATMRSENDSRMASERMPRYCTVRQNAEEKEEDARAIAEKSSITAPSRHSSVSSLSEEGSLGSIEEWALLELCITSGAPRNKCRMQSIKPNESAIAIANHEDCQALPEDNYSVCSYNSYVCKT